jgi:hypothetical protein
MTRMRMAFATSVMAAVSVATGLAVRAASSRAPAPAPPVDSVAATLIPNTMAVLAYNDLGMHCMGQDNSELMILPPYNNLHAQVVRRGGEPRIISSGITVKYTIPSNTHSADKDNFWTYAPALLGVTLAPDMGLAGYGLSGAMAPTGDNDWAATGIPITPIDDTGRENPYPLATVTVLQNGVEVARTQTVVPVSWEMNCQICHTTPGISVATDILRKHDKLHGTNLENQKPVLCAGCHADNALGMAGRPGVSNLSSAMHLAHASRMAAAHLAVDCYACHPGVRTQCQRDVHFSKGYTCTFCHTSMTAVGDPSRQPWIDEPRCGNCHTRTGFQFEQTGLLFKQSKGHMGVHCEACHGSPHAITPTVMDVDNVQASAVQGHTGIINTCTTCHSSMPSESFPHRLSD